MSSSQSGASSNTSSIDRKNLNSAQRPPDEMPKLDLAENLTKESGFDESGRQQLGPIGGEEATNKEHIPGTTDTVHIPKAESSQNYIQTFRKVAGGDSAQGGVAGLSVLNEDDMNLTVITHKEDVSPVSEAAENESTKKQQEMVLPSSSNQQKSNSSSAPNDVVEKSLAAIRQENERKNTKINKLEVELAICKKHESELQEEVDDLREENQMLECELATKEKEIKSSKEEHEHRIQRMESELKEKEIEVEQVKVRLAESEQQNEAQKQELQDKIEVLEQERKELKSTVDELKDDHKRKDLESRQQIIDLKEKLVQKQAEENVRFKELCDLKVKLAQSETEIARQTALLNEKDLALEREKAKDHGEAIKKMKDEKHELVEKNKKLAMERDTSLAEIQGLKEKQQESIEERAESDAKIHSLEAQIDDLQSKYQPCIDSNTPSVLERKDSSTQCSGSTQNPPVEHQSSQTESAGLPSRTTSAEAEPPDRQISSTESNTNNDSDVCFEIGSDNEDGTLDLETQT